MSEEEEISKSIGRVIPKNGDIMKEIGDPRAGMFGGIVSQYGSLDEFFKDYIELARTGDKNRDNTLLRQLIDKVVPSLQAQALVIDDRSKLDTNEEMDRLRGIFSNVKKEDDTDDNA